MRRICKYLVICILLAAAIFLYVKFFQPAEKGFSVTFFDVGQGDSALIRFADGEKMLVDCGPDRKILSKLGGALPFYDNGIDYLLITHPDLDHYGGCLDVMKKYGVKNIIYNGMRKEDDKYWLVWDDWARGHSSMVSISAPQKWRIGGSTLDFFSPDGAFNLGAGGKEGNNGSVVFKLTGPSTTVLFTGDMEVPLEECLLTKYCRVSSAAGCPKLKSDILKVGHHGSDSSTGLALLEAVRPERAVISVGWNNFGHPSLRVLKRLGRARIDILRTDEAGDIIIK